ncbi:winged helix DNA-binding protein [Chelatococcus composti]|jgi:predicted MarR family transcription regulator|uniref:Putative MarR family transcription regulator n=1 Tax=Chelatococcus composti TaxID=1743235 RepID=A0A841KAW5_9HYPH|nr:winged helix DNA-binding protein [Chelatococcus composti]MBB6168014.1 putative MarR family transcription regulator [Chelatococcus composti]MBS7734794.1 winged helix DNA-binding protein [Chelatococcus composti]PZN45451.1 MAG: transcriptional regulator [Pseudomonadota bacterium]GGG34176.1 transcriptional regulator [Chelatococcus composti]
MARNITDSLPAEAQDPPALGPIVSSAHLASGALPALSEFEFGLILVSHAFHRWMVRGMAAAGVPDLSPLDVLVLHSVNHRGKPKRLADICLVLNVEDTHLVTYSVKKLERLRLVKSGRKGKEKTVAVTPEGERACLRYKAIREQLLVRAVRGLGFDENVLSQIASNMRALSGHYDQAARSAASL